MTKKIVIDCCKDCPSYDDYPDTCMKMDKRIDAQFGIGYTPIPEWCPLEEG